MRPLKKVIDILLFLVAEQLYISISIFLSLPNFEKLVAHGYATPASFRACLDSGQRNLEICKYKFFGASSQKTLIKRL